MNHMSKACQEWQQGNVLRAIRLYQKMYNNKDASKLQKNIATYMIAYLRIQQAKAAKSEMAILGVDLSQPYQDDYYHAALCYKQITDKEFDPELLKLPVVTKYDEELMQEAYEYRAHLNRCANEFMPHKWYLDTVKLFQQWFSVGQRFIHHHFHGRLKTL